MSERQEMGSLLKEGCQALGLSLEEGQVQLFLEYLELVREWNRKINLTAIVDEKEFIIKHFLDSLTGAKIISGNGLLADIGSGAGLPGLALKIFYPGLRVTLVESLGKKAEFIATAARALKLENVQVVCGRAEELGRDPSFREGFEFAVCRAVSELAVIAEYCLPLVKAGGIFLAYKGEKAEEELSRGQGALPLLGGELSRIHKVKLPFSGDPRTLLEIKKITPTPEKYPRRTGIPAKRPLK